MLQTLKNFIFIKKDYKWVLGLACLSYILYYLYVLFQNTFLKPFPNYSKNTIGKITDKKCQRIGNNVRTNWLGIIENIRKKIDSESISPMIDQECRVIYSYIVHDIEYSISSETLQNDFDSCKVNDKVVVYYNTNDPRDSIIILKNTFHYKHFYVVLLFWFIIFILLITFLHVQSSNYHENV